MYKGTTFFDKMQVFRQKPWISDKFTDNMRFYLGELSPVLPHTVQQGEVCPMKLFFTKMQGAGNDYLFVDCRKTG